MLPLKRSYQVRVGVFAALLTVMLCASCSSVRQCEFYVRAINTGEEELKAVVLVNDEVLRFASDSNSDAQPVFTPAKVWIPFSGSNDRSGYEAVKLGVRTVVEDEEGNFTFDLVRKESMPYLESHRFIYHNDPSKQLFILRRNPSYIPN